MDIFIPIFGHTGFRYVVLSKNSTLLVGDGKGCYIPGNRFIKKFKFSMTLKVALSWQLNSSHEGTLKILVYLELL